MVLATWVKYMNIAFGLQCLYLFWIVVETLQTQIGICTMFQSLIAYIILDSKLWKLILNTHSDTDILYTYYCMLLELRSHSTLCSNIGETV